MIGLLLNRYVLGAIAAVAIVTGIYSTGYLRGYAKADQRARVAELQAALAAAQQDLSAQRIAAELSRQAAQINEQAAKDAEERSAAYEAELQKRGDSSRCRIGPDDLRWLSDRSPANNKKPARH